ncbi:DUF1697 domain-containing protein [Pseudonocardia sp.]|uniref:DUF1697 domain-containing protein n=1 Tax=Pseudonocardia sp. TaxID=60912 RepID=UPI002606F4F5|nr:DUF1697 domain-containing protein [Pseudonocardia sp.]
MPRFVALLRGINVGRNKRIAMAELRALLTDLGHTEVRTLLNSGNAVVTAADATAAEHAARIEAAIENRLAMAVPCVVLTADDLRTIAAGNPFAEIADDGSRMMVHVLAGPPGPDLLDGYDPVASDPEHARLVGRVIYQWCPDGLLAAPGVGWPADRRVLVTTRNWNTITKLVALL